MQIENYFANKKLKFKKGKLIETFPELSVCQHDNLNSLSQYIFDSPTKYYNRKIFDETYKILNDIISSENNIDFLNILSVNIVQFNHAVKTLYEINRKDIHENLLPNEDVELMHFISEKVLYEYLKVNDVVLLGLLKPIDFYFRKLNGKGTDNMDITNIINTLKKQKILNSITSLYDSVLRNSIAHGGVTFSSSQISFKDRHEAKDFYSWDYLKKFDNLIDCVNGVVFAYKKMFFQYFEVFSKYQIQIPESILEMELHYKANHYGWQIKHSYESTIPLGKQFNLSVETTLNSRKFMNFSAVYTAIKLEELMPNKFSTIFFHIKTKYKMSCWQSVNLENLRKFLLGEKIIVTDGTFFFEEKFWGEKKDWFIANKNFIKDNFKNQEGNFNSRFIKHHSKKTYNVIENASVVINNAENLGIGELEDFIRVSTKDIISFVNKEKNKVSNTFKEKFFPNKYYRINIYNKDNRKRAFYSISKDENLLATLHINRTKQISNIVPNWGVKEENRHCLIVWNKK